MHLILASTAFYKHSVYTKPDRKIVNLRSIFDMNNHADNSHSILPEVTRTQIFSCLNTVY